MPKTTHLATLIERHIQTGGFAGAAVAVAGTDRTLFEHYWSAWPSLSSARADADRPIFVGSARCDVLLLDAAAVHLELQVDHRRRTVMPRDPVARGAVSDDLTRQERVDVVDAVDLHGSRVLPPEAQQAHPALHLAQH